MAWIRTISPVDAKSNAEHAKLAELYRQVAGPDGQVDHILQSHSLRPRTLSAHLALYKAVLHSRPNDLSPRERELVGVCVSMLNGCEYCVRHHQAGLARHVGDPQLAESLAAGSVGDEHQAPLTEREFALCQYAKRLTLSPGEMTQNDLAPLRQVGLSDDAILDLNQIVAYFAYANRTVLGLGVSHVGEPLGLHPDEDREDYRHA